MFNSYVDKQRDYCLKFYTLGETSGHLHFMSFYFCYFGNLGLIVYIATLLAVGDKNEVF
jgi:hypothetical protein